MTDPSPAGPLIIYVDDERTNRIVFERSLTEFNVRSVDSGDAALAVLAGEDAAVLITDMRMPGMDGAAFLKEVAVRWPDAVRILLTGYADMESTIRAVNEGHIYR